MIFYSGEITEIARKVREGGEKESFWVKRWILGKISTSRFYRCCNLYISTYSFIDVYVFSMGW